MSDIATNYQQNIHQTGMTAAWSILFNISVVCGLFRFDRTAAFLHLVFGCIILILTFVFTLYFLVPYGFNMTSRNPYLYAHAILGCMMIGFVVLQVAGGLISRIFQQNKIMEIKKLKYIRATHRYFGYFLAIVYKINIIWSWSQTTNGFIALIIWEILWILAFILLKIFLNKLQEKVIDCQTVGYLCPQVVRTEEVSKVTKDFIIFANYFYDARGLQQSHPGGYKVIQLMRGREVDRFVYGMYSAELYPQLLPHSHSAFALQLVGNPIAKLVTPPTYIGFGEEVNEGEIRYKKVVSEKTQIYSLGIVLKHSGVRYLGYSDVRQLGQYYSFTIAKKVTRLYTTVNFLNSQNIELMLQLLQIQGDIALKKISHFKHQKGLQTQLPKLAEDKDEIRQRLTEERAQQQRQDYYVPIMLKVYNDGKLTAALRAVDFANAPIQISVPRGRGLELQATAPGRVIIVAGGTGIFPFSDLIDLLFKDLIVSEGHKVARQLKRRDPILQKKAFQNHFFVFLIAINDPQDLHPVTLGQLIRLSEHAKTVKVVLRVSKNGQKLQKCAGNIQFTREYFNKRVLSEASVKGFSKVWICGPPKLNTDTANILLQNGYNSQNFLLV